MREEQINDREVLVQNTVAEYIRKQPHHTVQLKIIMPHSAMNNQPDSDDVETLNFEWKYGTGLSRICGLMIEIRNPEQENTAPYRYLCGLNHHFFDNSTVSLRYKLEESESGTRHEQNNALLRNLDLTLSGRFRLPVYENPEEESCEVTFQTGAMVSNIDSRLKLYLIENKEASSDITRTILLDFPQQSISRQAHSSSDQKKSSHVV